MGNCRSAPNQSATPGKAPTTINKVDVPAGAVPAKGSAPVATKIPDQAQTFVINDKSCSTAVLIQSILPMVTPIVRHAVSQQLVNGKMILKNEKLVEEVQENDLPLGPIDISLDDINVVDCTTLCKDQEDMPEFAWPEKERVIKTAKEEEEAKSSSEADKKKKYNDELLVLDILGFSMRINFAPGIEFTIPVQGPWGITANLEIGSGGSVDHAWFQVDVPKLRIWYVNETHMAYVAFLARPSLVPHIHVNADRGNGDFFQVEFASGGGGLDDVVESILCGFGPSSVTHPKDDDGKDKKTKNETKEKTNWVADAIGHSISQAISRFANMGGDRPLEINLSTDNQSSTDAAPGTPRPAEEIKADIARLQAELELVEGEKGERGLGIGLSKTLSSASTSTPMLLQQPLSESEKKDTRGDMVVVVKDDTIKDKSTLKSPLTWCGLGA